MFAVIGNKKCTGGERKRFSAVMASGVLYSFEFILEYELESEHC